MCRDAAFDQNLETGNSDFLLGKRSVTSEFLLGKRSVTSEFLLGKRSVTSEFLLGKRSVTSEFLVTSPVETSPEVVSTWPPTSYCTRLDVKVLCHQGGGGLAVTGHFGNQPL